MKAFSLLLLSLLAPLSLSAQDQDPTLSQPLTQPRMTAQFPLGNDRDRKWGPGSGGPTFAGFLYQFVPEGQTVETWNEKIVQQVALTSMDVRAYAQVWAVGMRGRDPKVELKPKPLADATIEIEYTAPTLKETGVRRFLPGPDGVYALAYQVRSDAKDAKRYQLWKGIVEAATLVPNPKAADADGVVAPVPAAVQDDFVAFAKLIGDHANKDFFPPPQTTLRMLHDDVEAYLKAHPEVTRPPSDALVIQILAAKYPAPVTPAQGR